MSMMLNSVEESDETLLACPSVLGEAIKNQLAWLEYVADTEFTPAERAKLLRDGQRFYDTLSKLTAKYID